MYIMAIFMNIATIYKHNLLSQQKEMSNFIVAKGTKKKKNYNFYFSFSSLIFRAWMKLFIIQKSFRSFFIVCTQVTYTWNYWTFSHKHFMHKNIKLVDFIFISIQLFIFLALFNKFVICLVDKHVGWFDVEGFSLKLTCGMLTVLL